MPTRQARSHHVVHGDHGKVVSLGWRPAANFMDQLLRELLGSGAIAILDELLEGAVTVEFLDRIGRFGDAVRVQEQAIAGLEADAMVRVWRLAKWSEHQAALLQ